MSDQPSLRLVLFARVGHRKLETFSEAFVEIVDVLEIFAAIVRGLPHLLDLDEIKNDFAKVTRRGDSPLIQDALGQIAILFVGENSHRFAEFLTRDMAFGLVVAFEIILGKEFGPHAHVILSMAESFEHEDIRIEVISLIATQQLSDWMVRIEHCSKAVDLWDGY